MESAIEYMVWLKCTEEGLFTKCVFYIKVRKNPSPKGFFFGLNITFFAKYIFIMGIGLY